MSLAESLRRALRDPPRGELLAADLPGEPMAAAAIPAAVLIAVTDRPVPGVVLTVRRDHMRTHAGQVAFPGGRIDPGENPTAAALREAQEELALQPEAVEVVGMLDPYLTVTGYAVTPVVGVVAPDLRLRPQEAEVADWFEAPLDFITDPANHHRRSALFRGQMRHYYEIDWNGRRIWGATAAMTINLARLLRGE